jgi:hypothetical protein
MGSLARRTLLAAVLLCAPALPAGAEEPLPIFPGPWRIEARLRLSGAVDDGVGFVRPDETAVANVIFDAASSRFGVSLWLPGELWLLQVGALASDRRGQPELEPDDTFERGVAALACEALSHPPPCDAPADALVIEVAESRARARLEKGVLRVSGKLRLVISDPSRPALRIRFGASWEARGEPPPPAGFDLAAR